MTTSLASRRRLEARTVELAVDVDLARVAGQNGVLWQEGRVGFAGLGVAAKVTVAAGRRASDAAAVAAEVGDLLSSIDVIGPRRPLAIGALPFSSLVEGELIVPEVLVRREDDGGSSLTVTGSNFDPEVMARTASWAADRSRHNVALRPGGYLVKPITDAAAWCERVTEAARAVAAGRLSKVVLAREVAVLADGTIPASEVARRLTTAYPSCMVFLVNGFAGASPELLVARHGDRVTSRPLAGTAPRQSRPDSASWLMSSSKERQEHRLVVDAVAATLASFCRDLAAPETPSVVPVGTIAHLGTHLEGRLEGQRPSALELAAALHPTPAVAGTPTETAVAHIAEAEGVDRGRYAGPVGWVDSEGDGRWAVGIRSAQLSGSRARLLAGAGIVADSVAEAELAETELKLQPMLNAIVRP